MSHKTPNDEGGIFLECGKPFFGRKDKQFCSISCKNRYHNREVQERRSYRLSTISAISSNYQILDAMLKDKRTSADLSELEKAGFDPAFITGHRRGSLRHDDYACFDIRFFRSDTRIFNIRRLRLNGR